MLAQNKLEKSGLVDFRLIFYVEGFFSFSWKKFPDMEHFSFSVYFKEFVQEHSINLLLVTFIALYVVSCLF